MTRITTTTETIEEYDGKGNLLRKTVTTTREEENDNNGWTTTWTYPQVTNTPYSGSSTTWANNGVHVRDIEVTPETPIGIYTNTNVPVKVAYETNPINVKVTEEPTSLEALANKCSEALQQKALNKRGQRAEAIQGWKPPKWAIDKYTHKDEGYRDDRSAGL